MTGSDARSYESRVQRFSAVSGELTSLSDAHIKRLLESATSGGIGFSGTLAETRIKSTDVFIKRIPLASVELANFESTANYFDLPNYFHYGVGSAGFGAWRELRSHIMTTEWALDRHCESFPLLYHWRVVDVPSQTCSTSHFGSLEAAVRYWGSSRAVQSRLLASARAPATVVLFLEHFPETLGQWLPGQPLDVLPDLDCKLGRVLDFMRRKNFLHMDPHFANIMSDGVEMYLTDFGMAMSPGFDLSVDERDFFASHRNYDEVFVGAHLVNSAILPRLNSEKASADVNALVSRYGDAAIRMNKFHKDLSTSSVRTEYPPELRSMRVRSREKRLAQPS
jgi:hypothetical protein